jgi:hypothetical protein
MVCARLRPRALINGDLPNEEAVVALGQKVSGNKAHHLALGFGQNAGVVEVGALQKVAVDGVLVEWLAAFDQLIDRSAVTGGRSPDDDVG